MSSSSPESIGKTRKEPWGRRGEVLSLNECPVKIKSVNVFVLMIKKNPYWELNELHSLRVLKTTSVDISLTRVITNIDRLNSEAVL